MEENDIKFKQLKKKIVVTTIILLTALVLGVGGVYAYFAATVTQDTTSNVSISAVSGLAISFSHSPNLEIENALPGQSWSKTFSATLTNNTSEIGITYNIKLHVTENSFGQSEGYLTYTLTGSDTMPETQIKQLTEGDITILENKTIKGNKTTNEVVHTYTLTISYPNNDASIQTQGGVFNGYVYFEPGNNQIYDNIKYTNHEGTINKSKYNLSIGDLVTIGTEEFYVIPYEDGSIVKNGKVQALAKYNLLVGKNCDKDGNNCKVISTNELGYGMQNETAKGMMGESERVGVTEFSNASNVGTNCASNLQTNGKCYTTYEGSLAEKYVEQYVNNLSKIIIGDETITGKLISRNELQTIKKYYTGDNLSTVTANENFNDWNLTITGYVLPTWLWSTTYWTGSPWYEVYIWKVGYDGILNGGDWYSSSNKYGIRPVIIF